MIINLLYIVVALRSMNAIYCLDKTKINKNRIAGEPRKLRIDEPINREWVAFM